MDPISNADRLVMLLRRRLQSRARASGASSTSSRPLVQDIPALEGVQALAGELNDRQLGRTLIQAVMADGFGEELVNEARFQNVVDQVVEALESDPLTAKLLSRAISDLRTKRG